MEPISTLLAAGAAAALSDVAGQAVKDAYTGLKSVLAGRLASLGLIEQDPRNDAFRKAVTEEIRRKNLTADADVLAKLDALGKALEQDPPDRRERLGVAIEEVRAAHDVIIRQIESHGGITLVRVVSKEGKVQIEDLKSEGSSGN